MFSWKGYKNSWLRHTVITLVLIMAIMALDHGLYSALIIGIPVYNFTAFVMS
jgi:hypothetical protein